MRELAEALKGTPGLRMRQGVVTTVSGAANSVLIGGSTIPVDDVQHLNSCAPQVGDVVWVASNGADLWIIGTHGDPPPIDPARLPAFETYFAGADTAGDPAPVSGLAGAAAMTGVMLSWDLPPEALWRTWEVYEGTTAGFTPGAPILETTSTVVTIAHDPASGPWYYKVRAVNSRGEASSFVEAGPFTLPATIIADGAITAVKIGTDAITAPKIKAGEISAVKLNVADVQAAVVTAARVNTLALNASVIQSGTIDTARLNATEIQAAVVTAAKINALTLNAVSITGGSIAGVSITGQTITGGTIRTGSSGDRIELTGADQDAVSLYAGGYVVPAMLQIGEGSSSHGSGWKGLGIAGPLAEADGIPYGIVLQQRYGATNPLTGYETDITMFADQITIAAPLGYIELDGEINPGVPTLFGGSIDVEGSCRVVGRINSETNYPGTGTGWNSIDGVWIQENSPTVANRWKMTYNATSRVLSLSRGTVRHTSPAFSVA